jgi:hypothetical protein
MDGMPEKDEVLNLVSRVSHLTGPIAGEEARELPRHYLELMALYDRCRSLLAAIRTLIEAGFVHEAWMLNRPLVTDSLALAELASSDETRRAELLVGWERKSLANMRGIMLEAEAQDGIGEPGIVKWLDKRSAEVDEYARERDIRGRSWQPDDHVKELATKHDRLTEYLDVRVSGLFIHGTTFATSLRYSPAEDGRVMVGGPAAQLDQWVVGCGCLAAQSALLASRDFCTILEIEEPPELATLFAELQSLADRIKAASERPPTSEQ